MKTAVFWGCCILTEHYAYEMSVREVMPKLDVELVTLKSASCCGDPIKSVNDFAVTYLSARTLALTETTGLGNLLVPCNRCHLTLSEAKYRLENELWSSRVGDILMHVLFHSAYHRGQIALQMRASGVAPAYTDYIHAVRQEFVE